MQAAVTETAHYKLALRPLAPMDSPTLLIPSSIPADLSAIAAVYAWHVKQGAGTFEPDAPNKGDPAQRREEFVGKAAVIGHAANPDSLGLNCTLVFVHTSVLEGAGWETPRWIDVLPMQRPSGGSTDTPPAET